MSVASLERPSFTPKSEPHFMIAPYQEAQPEQLSSHELCVMFAQENERLGIPFEAQRAIDKLLWQLGEVDARTADHCRRVGDYTGAVIGAIGGEKYANDYHVLVGRLAGAGHDVGKVKTPAATLHRTWGDEGWGEWRDSVDMPAIEGHAKDGYKMIARETSLPQEIKYGAGCHHVFVDQDKPGRHAYGIPLAEIDEVYKDDPDMKEWVHFMIKAVVAADIFDAATTRKGDSYLDPETDEYEHVRKRLEKIFPDQHEDVMTALLIAQQRLYGYAFVFAA